MRRGSREAEARGSREEDATSMSEREQAAGNRTEEKPVEAGRGIRSAFVRIVRQNRRRAGQVDLSGVRILFELLGFLLSAENPGIGEAAPDMQGNVRLQWRRS